MKAQVWEVRRPSGLHLAVWQIQLSGVFLVCKSRGWGRQEQSRLEKMKKKRWNTTLTTQRRTLAMKESKVNRKDKAIGEAEVVQGGSTGSTKSSDQTLGKR